MQIKLNASGKSYSLIRTTYSAEKGRGVNSTVGSFKASIRHCYDIDQDLLSKLDDAEKQQLNDFLDHLMVTEYREKAVAQIEGLPAALKGFLDATESPLGVGLTTLNDELAAEIYEQMAEVRKRLKKRGFPQARVLKKDEEEV